MSVENYLYPGIVSEILRIENRLKGRKRDEELLDLMVWYLRPLCYSLNILPSEMKSRLIKKGVISE